MNYKIPVWSGSNPIGRRALSVERSVTLLRLPDIFFLLSHLVNNGFQKHLSIVKQNFTCTVYIRYNLSTTINYDLIVNS